MQIDMFATAVVVDLGSIGLPVAAAFSASGVEVLGHDIDAGRLEYTQTVAAGLTEPDLAAAIRIASDAGLLRFSSHLPRRPKPILGVGSNRCAYAIVPTQTPGAVAFGAAAIVLANNHPALAALDLDRLTAMAHPRALIYDLCGQSYGRKLALQPGQTVRILDGGQTVGAPAPVFA
jgi:hypothetical protein